MVTHDMTEITEAEEGALPGQVVLSILYIVYVGMPSPTKFFSPLLTLFNFYFKYLKFERSFVVFTVILVCLAKRNGIDI